MKRQAPAGQDSPEHPILEGRHTVANRHFAKLADVWKHLPLAQILATEQPDHYCETHAGNASYAMVDDPERHLGVTYFREVAAAHPALTDSKYLHRLRKLESPDGALATYPGAPLLAMHELANRTAYLFCDLDQHSVDNLEREARSLGVTRATCVAADGMTAVADYLAGATGRAFVHIDPYDPRATGPSGLSALDLARALIRDGVGLMYWYGYSRPSRRVWALDQLADGANQDAGIWCGDVMITTTAKDTSDDGDLGVATTPGTGFGIVCANISAQATDACGHLGRALALAYSQVTLPNGDQGSIDFTVMER